MDPHVHLGGVSIIGVIASSIAIFGTLHLLAISHPDNRASRAYIALGF